MRLNKYINEQLIDDQKIELVYTTEEDDLLEYIEFIRFTREYNLNELHEGILDKISSKLKSKISFIKDIAGQTKLKVKELIPLISDFRVFKFFQKIGWSFKKLFGLLKKGFKVAHTLADVISEYMAETKVAKWTTNELKKLDEFLSRHPMIKRVTGVAVAGILVYIWFNMTFTGDVAYDFDMSTVLAALGGTLSLSKIFGGAEGIKLLMLFVTGAALGLSFPWPGSGSVKFISAILGTLATKLKIKVPDLLRKTKAMRR